MNLWYWLMGLVIAFRRVTIRFKLIVVSAVALGGIWAFWNTTSGTPYYQGSTILSSPYLNTQVAQNIVDYLNGLEGDRLGEELGVAQAAAQQARFFNFSVVMEETERTELERVRDELRGAEFTGSFIDNLEEQITIQVQSYEFTVDSYNRDVLDTLLRGLVSFTRDYDYIGKRIAVNRQNLELKKLKLRRESQKLDSLKSLILATIQATSASARQGSNNVILAEEGSTNPLNVFEQDLLLYDEELEIERQLALEEDFQVFRGSSQMTTPASPSFWENLLRYLAITLGVAYGVIFLIQINKYLTRVEKERFSSESAS